MAYIGNVVYNMQRVNIDTLVFNDTLLNMGSVRYTESRERKTEDVMIDSGRGYMVSTRKLSNPPKIALRVVELMIDGMPLRDALKRAKMKRSAWRRVIQVYAAELLPKIEQARKTLVEDVAHEMLYIADNEEDLDRAKLKIQTRQWIAERFDTEVYGKIQKNLTTIEVSIADQIINASKGLDYAAKGLEKVIEGEFTESGEDDEQSECDADGDDGSGDDDLRDTDNEE